MKAEDILSVDELKRYCVIDLQMPDPKAICYIIDIAYRFGHRDGVKEMENGMIDLLKEVGGCAQQEPLSM